MAYINKKRDSDDYCQLSIQIPVEFKNKLKDEAVKNKLTVTQYIIITMNQILDGDIVKIDAKENEDYEKINNKLDTIINLISKL